MSRSYAYPISAVIGNTWREPRGPFAHPGAYTARLTVNGKTIDQKLTVSLDPRVKTPASGLQTQFDLSMRAYNGMNDSMKTMAEVRAVRRQLVDAITKEKSATKKKALEAEDQKIAAFDDDGFGRANQQLAQVLDLLQEVDETPTKAVAAAVDQKMATLGDLIARWPAARGAGQKAAGLLPRK